HLEPSFPGHSFQKGRRGSNVDHRCTCTLVTASPKASVTECVHLCIIERSQRIQLLREHCLILLTGQVPMFESRCAGNTQLHTLLAPVEVVETRRGQLRHVESFVSTVPAGGLSLNRSYSAMVSYIFQLILSLLPSRALGPYLSVPPPRGPFGSVKLLCF